MGAWPFDSDFGFYTDNHASITSIFKEEVFGGRGEILIQGVFVNSHASENFQKHYLAMSYNGKKDVYELDYVPFANSSVKFSVINIAGSKVSVIVYYGERYVLIDVDREKNIATSRRGLEGDEIYMDEYLEFNYNKFSAEIQIKIKYINGVVICG